jgi:hypothetical protein
MIQKKILKTNRIFFYCSSENRFKDLGKAKNKEDRNIIIT